MLLLIVASPIEASVVPTPTPADREIAIALSDETAPDAAMEITSWSATAVTDTPRLVSVTRDSVRNRSFTLSKVKLSLKSPSASRVSLSPPLDKPSNNGDDVCVATVSMLMVLLP